MQYLETSQTGDYTETGQLYVTVLFRYMRKSSTEIIISKRVSSTRIIPVPERISHEIY